MVIWAGCALLVVACYATLLLSEDVVDVLVREDGIFEFAGAAGFLVAGVLFLLSAHRDWNRVRLRALATAGLGVVMLVAAGEEISWSQRIFGWGTPEGLDNVQGETNIHNFAPVQGKLDTLFQVFWAVQFVAVPAAAAVSERARELLGRLLPVGPLVVAFLLCVNWLGSKLAVPVLDGTFAGPLNLVRSVVEIKEGIVGVLLAVAAFVIWRGLARPANN